MRNSSRGRALLAELLGSALLAAQATGCLKDAAP
jgi:hypothetical protein